MPLRAWHAVWGLAGEATEHQPRPRHGAHRFAVLRAVCRIFPQSSIAADPDNRAFYHPPAWQDRQRRHRRWVDLQGRPSPASGPLDKLQAPTPVRGQPQAPRVTPRGHVGPHTSPLGVRGKRRGQEPGRRDRLTQSGGVAQDTQEETRRLNEEMTCATIELLRPIIAIPPLCRSSSPAGPQ
jgi:hypothetical protein